MRALVLLVAGCASHAAPAPTTARSETGTPPPLAAGVGTAVVVMPPKVAVPALDGPFLVTTINPGSSMDLAIATSRDCAASSLVWFDYSGGGVAVGAGQTLCARSHADGERTNGFSGYDPTSRP